MVLLKQLLEAEISNAAKKAKSLGLVSGGYGKWVDANGVTKGRSVRGEFVPVKDKEEPTPDKPHKPASMTRKSAGIEKPNIATNMNPDGTKKLSATSAVKKSEKDMKDVESDTTFTPTVSNVQLNQNSPLVKRNNNASWRKNPPASPLELEVAIPPHTDILALRKEIVPGETARLFQNDSKFDMAIVEEFPHFYQRRTNIEGAYPVEILPDNEWSIARDKLDKVAVNQAQQWRRKLDANTQLELLDAQSRWRYNDDRQKRREFGSVIQKIVESAPEKPYIETTEPICRGMTIAIDDVKNFLSNFGVGREIEMPVSSFTLSPGAARNFAHNYGVKDTDQVNVFIRVFPNKENKVYGLTMNKPYTPETVHTQKTPREMNNSTFDNEFEILRFPGTKANCINVEKLIATGKGTDYEFTKFTYIIDLEEMGPQQKEMQESVNAMDDSLYIMYMQLPMKIAKKKKTTLKSLIPKEENEAKEKGVPYTNSDSTDYMFAPRKDASTLRKSIVI